MSEFRVTSLRRNETSEETRAIKRPIGILPVALVLLSGCATVYEGKYDWDAGWREGSIEAIGVAGTLPQEPSHDCDDAPTYRSSPRDQFASVAYLHMRARAHRIVPLPDSSFHIGDAVYVNVSNCKEPLRHRDT